MANNLKQKIQKAPWRERFLNVVERTIIELNIQFSNYSVRQAANGETKKRIFDQTTQGIEFSKFKSAERRFYILVWGIWNTAL